MKFEEVMGFSVFSDNLENIESKCKIINTISPNSYGISIKDSKFREALKESDVLVLDGVYFALASIILNGKNIQKNQGPDLFDFFIKKMNRESGKVFFLGSSTTTLDKIKHNIKKEYPKVHSEYFSPPFKSEFNEHDNIEMINAINNFEPDILFIGMTCPKQEKWAIQNKSIINAKMICSIGAVFDWYAGNEKPIAPIWWKLRLAWLIRTIHRPEILKRYPNIGIFFWHLLLSILGNKKYKYGKF